MVGPIEKLIHVSSSIEWQSRLASVKNRATGLNANKEAAKQLAASLFAALHYCAARASTIAAAVAPLLATICLFRAFFFGFSGRCLLSIEYPFFTIFL